MVVIISKKINELVTKYHENKLSHAFLLVTNDINKCNKDIVEFIKEISCLNKYQDACQDCNLCYQIENDVIPNIKKIYPDGQQIKKNQILELKEQFKTKPLYISNNIYIINNAEKLNGAAANTMLKFLEEPENNILGFFVTTNKEAMLETIKSRCQIIYNPYDNEDITEILNLTDQQLKEFTTTAKEYLFKLINKTENGIYLNKKCILSVFMERERIINFFNYLYWQISEVINKTNQNDLEILKNIPFAKLLKIQKAIFNVLESSSFNVNIELLLDNFALEMEEL